MADVETSISVPSAVAGDGAYSNPDQFTVGTRVIHAEGGHRGTIRFAGHFAPRSTHPDAPGAQFTLGVEWDEAKGRNDGSTGGTRLFTCKPHHGSFILPSKVVVAAPLDDVLCTRYTAGFVNVQSKFCQMRGKDPSFRDPESGAFVNVWNVDCSATPELHAVNGATLKLGTWFPFIQRLSVTNSRVVEGCSRYLHATPSAQHAQPEWMPSRFRRR